MECTTCGTTLPDDATFCTNCGVLLAEPETMEYAATQEIPIQELEMEPFAQESLGTAPTGTPAFSQPETNELSAPSVLEQRDEPYFRLVNNREPLGVWTYVGMLLVLFVPAVNVVMFVRWLCQKSANVNKRNFALALLIVLALCVLILIWIGRTFDGVYDPVWRALEQAYGLAKRCGIF